METLYFQLLTAKSGKGKGSPTSLWIIWAGLSLISFSVQAQTFAISGFNSISPTQYWCINSAYPGLTATFNVQSCNPSRGQASVTYQWYVATSNAAIPASPGTSLNWTAVGPTNPTKFVGTSLTVDLPLTSGFISTTGTRFYYCVVTASTQNCGATYPINSTSVEVKYLNAPFYDAANQWTPTNSAVCAGASAQAISITMQPSAATTYTWSVPAGSSSVASISSVTGANNNTANVIFSGTAASTATINVSGSFCGGTTSGSKTYTISNSSFTTQPSTTVRSTCLNTAFAAPTSLSVTVGWFNAVGTLQWYSNTTASNTGGTVIAGATTASYTPPNNTAGTFYYYCVATNPAADGGCTVASAVSGAWTVNALPVINTQPITASQTVCLNVPFRTNPSVDDGLGSYQWWSTTTANSTTTGAAISGATSSSYTPPVSTNNTTTYYYCVVTGSNLCTAKSNASGAFIVNNAVGVTGAALSPTAAASACQNGTFTNNLTVAGNGIKSYQWYSKTSTANFNSPTIVNGATSATFSPPTSNTGSLFYFCATTGCNNVISNIGWSGQHTVNANPATPTTASPTADRTCTGSSNGSVSANVGGNTANFTWAWYSGATATGTAISSAASVSSLGSGQYTVQATSITTGCSSTATQSVAFTPTYPATPTVSTTADNTSCTGSNGAVSATVGGLTAGFDFAWYSGASVSGNAISTSAATSATLAAGQYTVQATFPAGNVNQGCSSSGATATVTNNLTYPSVQTSQTDQTNCTTANGTVAANVGSSYATGTTTGHSFSWYTGNTVSGSPISATSSAANLGSGNYTVLVTSTSTGCTNTATLTVGGPTYPSVQTSITDRTSCISDNGSAAANVGSSYATGTTTGHTFAWYTGSTVAGSPISNTPNATNLGVGTYTVQATNNTTGCASSSQATVASSLDVPSAAVLSSSTTFPVCPNGSVSVQVVVTGGSSPYSFTLSNGNTVPAGYTSGSAASVAPNAETTLTLASVTDALGCTTSTGFSGSVVVTWKTLTEWNAGSGAWTSDGNWTCGVPTATLDATIAGAVTVTLPSAPSNVRLLTVGSGATLTFAPGSVLEIRGNLVNNGTINYSPVTYTTGTALTTPMLRFNGSAAQTISGSGIYNVHNLNIANEAGVVNESNQLNLFNTLSLTAPTSFDADGAGNTAVLRLRSNTVAPYSADKFEAGNIAEIPAGATFTGKVNVQRHLGTVLSSKWRYVAIPVYGFTLSAELPEWILRSAAYVYDEKLSGTLNTGWTKIPTTYAFTLANRGVGFQSWNTPSVYEARGELNQGTIKFPITYTPTIYPEADGWNVVGNPYPSNIQWNSSDWIYSSDIGPAIYVPDPELNVWKFVDVAGVGNIPGGIIALGQAFWVYSTGPGRTPTLEIKETAKRAQRAEYYRQAAPAPGLSFTLKYASTEDNAFMYEASGTSLSFDPRHDVPKMEGRMMGISILSNDGRKLAISRVPAHPEWTPLNIWGAEAGRYIFSVSQLSSDAAFPELYLVDQLQGTSQKIENGAEIELFLSASDQQGNGRFFISTTSMGSSEKKEVFTVYPNPAKDRLNIQLPADGPVNVAVMGSSGVRILHKKLIPVDGMASGELDITALSSGMYMVETELNGTKRVARFIKF